MDPYPAYRPSGVDWLGEVPEHWEVVRLREVADMEKGVSFTSEELEPGDVPVIAGGREPAYYHNSSNRPAGTVTVSATGAYAGFVAFHNTPIFATDCTTVRARSGLSDTTFVFHTLKQSEGMLYQHRRGSAQPHVYPRDIASMFIALPSLDEQRAIAAYLDRETERIDALVAKKRLLIERLDEYRAALITRTVTRGLPPEAARAAGLDPSPRLKPSGVEWLGEVPEHWDVRRLEQVASYRTSSVDKKAEEGEIPVRLCNYTDAYYQDRIQAGNGDFMEATASPREIARFHLRIGDVLITKDSEDWQDIGVPALIEETAADFVCGYHLGIVRPDKDLDAGFLFRLMQSRAVNHQLQTSASGVTRYGLPNSAVGDAVLPLPPLDEQRAIAAFLDRETERVDALVNEVETAIERLQEYRTALITAAVTGKVDVRE